MMKILFLHGFYASGQCVPAVALREALEGKAEVLTPDLPMHPKEAINFIRDLIDREKPDALVGNSCGSFYAQMIAPIVGLPALLGNPHFKMTEFLKPRIVAHQYKSPRKDGKQDFIIDEQLIAEFAELEEHQFDCYNPYYKDWVMGLFVTRIHWLTLNRCLRNTTAGLFTFLAGTLLQPKRFTSIMLL